MSPPAGRERGLGYRPRPLGRADGDPRFFEMLGRSGFALRQGFASWSIKRLLRRTCGGPCAAGTALFVLLADQYITAPCPCRRLRERERGPRAYRAAHRRARWGPQVFENARAKVDSPLRKVCLWQNACYAAHCGGPLAAGKPVFVLLAESIHTPHSPCRPPAGPGAGARLLSATRKTRWSGTMAATLAAFSGRSG